MRLRVVVKLIEAENTVVVARGWGTMEMESCYSMSIKHKLGFPGGTVVENLPANAGDTGSSPGLGRSHMLRSN